MRCDHLLWQSCHRGSPLGLTHSWNGILNSYDLFVVTPKLQHFSLMRSGLLQLIRICARNYDTSENHQEDFLSYLCSRKGLAFLAGTEVLLVFFLIKQAIVYPNRDKGFQPFSALKCDITFWIDLMAPILAFTKYCDRNLYVLPPLMFISTPKEKI